MNNLHENENYAIHLNDNGDGYEVFNRNTLVVEFTSENLPECLFAAENMNVVIKHNTWSWVAKRADDQAVKDAEALAAAGPTLTSVN